MVWVPKRGLAAPEQSWLMVKCFGCQAEGLFQDVNWRTELCSFPRFDVRSKVAYLQIFIVAVSSPGFFGWGDPFLYTVFLHICLAFFMCVYARFVHVESVTNVTSSRPDTSHPPWHPCNSRSACLFAAEGRALSPCPQRKNLQLCLHSRSLLTR